MAPPVPVIIPTSAIAGAVPSEPVLLMVAITSILLAVTVVLSIFAIVPFNAGAAEIAENTDQTEASSYLDPKPSGDYEIGATDAASEKAVEDELGADVADSSNGTVDTDAEVGDNNAAVKPASPTLSLSNTVNGLTAAWNKVDNAEFYRVFYRSVADGEGWTSFDTTDTSCVIPDTVSGTLYFVKVQSIGADELEGEGFLPVDESELPF